VPPCEMNFVVDRVGSESQQIAEHLFQLYAHDFSEFAPLEDDRFVVDDDGLFALPLIEKYWTQPNHSFYLFRADGKLAGFAAINDWSPSGRGADHNIAEFFVMRHYRRHGAGTQLARQLFLAHPGSWELAIMASNKPAQAFWPTVIAGTPHSGFEKIDGDGIRWHGPIYRFEIGRL
jgi:predicted acetyltransferase